MGELVLHASNAEVEHGAVFTWQRLAARVFKSRASRL